MAHRMFIAFLASILVASTPRQMEDTATDQPDSVNVESVKKIKFGMTRQEVVWILGRPPEANVAEHDRKVDADYPTLNPAIRQQGDFWRAGALRVWVLFHAGGKVVGMSYESTRTSK
jgi:SmpA/OmlA family protein